MACSIAAFYEEVSAWHLDSEQYPYFNDVTLFTAWFEIEFFDMVSDALDAPLTKTDGRMLAAAQTGSDSGLKNPSGW